MSYLIFDDKDMQRATIPAHATERIRAIARFYDVTPASAQLLDNLCSRRAAADDVESQCALEVIRLLLVTRRDLDWSQRCLFTAGRLVELRRVRLARDLIVHASAALVVDTPQRIDHVPPFD